MAENESNNGILTNCGGKCGVCPTIIIPGIGQSDVYLLDENGSRAKDKNGRDISAFPLIIDTDYLKKALALPFVKMLITRKDKGFTGFAAEAVGKAAAKSAVDFTGHPVSSLELVRYPQSIAACSEAERGKIYDAIPLQDYAQGAGGDHLYYFAFNSFGNNLDAAGELYDFIQQVKRETGHTKVNIVPVSLGSTIANSLFEVFPQVKNDLNKIVFTVPALDGSRLAGDIYKGALRTQDESFLNELLPSLSGGNSAGNLVNTALKRIPKQIILDLLTKAIDKIRETVLLNCTMLWGLVPGGDYDKLAAKYLSDPAHAEIRRQTDIFHRAQMNSRANILAFVQSGVKVYDIVDYNFPLHAFVSSSKTHNGDGLIHLDSESMGAASGYIDTPLPDDYIQQNTYCSEPAHNHISPDRIVDASTGILPETTFYFRNQNHERTGENDVIMKLITEILLNDELKDIHSMPDRFPQFNAGRNTGALRKTLLPKAQAADRSVMSAEDSAELQGAVDECKAMLEETVVDLERCTRAGERLKNILVKIEAVK